MKIYRVFLFLIFCLSSATWASPSTSAGSPQACANAKECLNDFLGKEVAGASDIRFDYVRYSDPSRVEEYTVFWQGTSFKVVDGYTLDKETVNPKGMHVFKVRYHVLGHTTGVLYDRVLHKDIPHYEDVFYFSKNMEEGWYIIDPPSPYVSLDFLKKLYVRPGEQVKVEKDGVANKYQEMLGALNKRTRLVVNRIAEEAER